jgi:phage/plasmid-like protein (TIGR03299 family)
MSHDVESMFFTGERQKIWHGLGKQVGKALTSGEALKAAGLDWRVRSQEIYLHGSAAPIPGYRANVRVGAPALYDNGDPKINERTGKPIILPKSVLSITSDKYVVVQNSDAFSFVDKIIGGGNVRYDTAGSLRNGAVVWLLAKMPERDILGDKVEPFLCFSNSHDASSSVRVCITPVRVVCNNTLNIAIAGAKRCWATRHVGKIDDKPEEARFTLGLADKYMDGLKRLAEKYSSEKINDKQYREFIEAIFPLPENPDADKNKKKTKNVRYYWNLMLFCYNAPDIEKFRGTKWGALNAVSDAVYHGAPLRKTMTYRENLWANSMGGNSAIDKAVSVLDHL